MSIINKIKQVTKPKKKAMERSYRAKSQFLRDVKGRGSGLTICHAYEGYGRNRKTVPGLQMDPSEKILFMQRKNNNAVAIEISKEYKVINTQTVLLKVTKETYKLDPSFKPAGNDYHYYHDEKSVKAAMKKKVDKTETEYYLISLPPKIRIKVDGSILTIGPIGECKKSENDGKTVFTLANKTKIICMELKGINASLYDTVDEDKINYILEDLDDRYKSPTFKRQKIKWEKMKDGIKVGDKLILHKISDENKLNVNAGKLHITFDDDDVEIKASITTGSVLTYKKKSKTISQDIPSGTYLVRLQTAALGKNLYHYRQAVYSASLLIDIDFEVSRMDYLTNIDVSDETNVMDDSWATRVDPGASIDIDETSDTLDDDFSRKL